jgi:GDP-mannose 6-dehydrogenase
MKINIYGLGYVGCVTAACLANRGHNVTGVDTDPIKVNIINKGKSPIVEKGLDEAIRSAVESRRLKMTLNGAGPAEVSIVCVGTPSKENGSLDLTYIERVCEQIGGYLRQTDAYHVVNMRSTILPGTVEKVVIPILEKASRKKVGVHFGVCMNPEFMREGTSIHDFLHPPVTVIGEYDRKSGRRVSRLYKDLDAPLITTTIKTAEMIKYSCNTFHALKVVFANEIGNICKKLKIDSHKVMEIFCEDKKLNISSYYLKPGFAFGGSCLPKDLRAILYKSKEVDLELPLLSSILHSNKQQVDIAFQMILKHKIKSIGVLGLSFKPGTDDLRESPMVDLVERLIGKGYNILIYDKEVSLAKIFGSNKRYIERVIPHISSLMKSTADEVVEASELVVIGNKTREIAEICKSIPKKTVIIDLVKALKTGNKLGKRYDGICW